MAEILPVPKWKWGPSEVEKGHEEAVKPAWRGECGQEAPRCTGQVKHRRGATGKCFGEQWAQLKGVVRRQA